MPKLDKDLRLLALSEVELLLLLRAVKFSQEVEDELDEKCNLGALRLKLQTELGQGSENGKE